MGGCGLGLLSSVYNTSGTIDNVLSLPKPRPSISLIHNPYSRLGVLFNSTAPRTAVYSFNAAYISHVAENCPGMFMCHILNYSLLAFASAVCSLRQKP